MRQSVFTRLATVYICLENVCPSGNWLPFDMPQSLYLCRSEAKACLVYEKSDMPAQHSSDHVGFDKLSVSCEPLVHCSHTTY
jgi:hypothetical protein